MNLNVILEVAITLAFLYSLLSIIVSSVNELIIHARKKRGKFLLWALEEVFKDQLRNKDYASLLMRNPLIDRLRKTSKSLPSYISGVQFSEALIDVFCEEYANKKYRFSDLPNADGSFDLVPAAPLVHDAFSKFKASVQLMNNSDVKKLLNSFLSGTNDFDKLKLNIQNWYQDYMDRVNGWYKNDIQKYLFVISLGVAIAFNVNTIEVVKQMSRDKALREQLVKAAENYVAVEMAQAKNGTPKAADSTYQQIVKTITTMNDSIVGMGFPIGWDLDAKHKSSGVGNGLAQQKTLWNHCCSWAVTLLGWLLSALALSFGAPFWFDVLSKIVNLRKTGLKPNSTPTV